MLRGLFRTKDKRKNKEVVELTRSVLSGLKDKIKKMSEYAIEIENPDKMVDIVERILEFNRQNKEGQGLKILAPEQMLSRLLISLAHLKAGNNSQKLKNEIRI